MAWTYDLARLHAQVKTVIPVSDPFCVEVEVWDHRHGAGDVSVEVTISVLPTGGGVVHFRAPTPDGALAALRAQYETQYVEPERLGLITAPENAEAGA